MKKYLRILNLVLALVMLVSVLSIAAYAHTVDRNIYDKPNAKFGNPDAFVSSREVPNTGKPRTVAPKQQIRIGDDFYDLAGSMVATNHLEFGQKLGKRINNGEMEQTLKGPYSCAVFAYAPHNHKISPNAPWHYDENNHWKDCETCPCWLFMNWHHDVNNDGICDECHQPIVYRKLSVKDTEGGKVTISADKGTVGDRVAVTVKADPGYKLADLRGMNTTAKKYSFRPCIQDIKGSEYHFFVDVYDVEVVAKFVKE